MNSREIAALSDVQLKEVYGVVYEKLFNWYEKRDNGYELTKKDEKCLVDLFNLERRLEREDKIRKEGVNKGRINTCKKVLPINTLRKHRLGKQARKRESLIQQGFVNSYLLRKRATTFLT